MRHNDIKRGIAGELPHLRRFAYALTDDPSAADDLVQASVERALRRAGQWRRDGSLRSWLFRIVYTTHLNTRQSERRHHGATLEAVENVVGVRARQETVVDCLSITQALDDLPQPQRDAMVLVALEDVSYDEAADILGVPVGTVRSRLARARDALRASLWPRQRRLQRVK